MLAVVLPSVHSRSSGLLTGICWGGGGGGAGDLLVQQIYHICSILQLYGDGINCSMTGRISVFGYQRVGVRL